MKPEKSFEQVHGYYYDSELIAKERRMEHLQELREGEAESLRQEAEQHADFVAGQKQLVMNLVTLDTATYGRPYCRNSILEIAAALGLSKEFKDMIGSE